MTDDDLVRRLREEAQHLASEVRGTLSRVAIRSGDTQVELEWATAQAAAPTAAAPPPISPAPTAKAEMEMEEAGTGPAGAGLCVVSPLVGTFYHAPSPDAPPFVSVGDRVEEDTVVGIVEAMKLMNNVTADKSGFVTAFLVPSKSPVEYGQSLIALSPERPEEEGGR